MMEVMTKQLQESESKRQQEADNAKAQIGVLMDKVKRLKMLLAKSRDLAHEKELEMQKFGAKENGPWQSFSVLCRVLAGAASTSIQHEGTREVVWCLLSSACPSSPSCSNGTVKYRWEEENIVQQWLANGHSSLSGGWPETVQEAYAKREEAIQRECEEAKESLQLEIKDVNQKFQSYKVKAQAALKRLGKEDHMERHRQHVIEEGQLTDLRQRIQSMEKDRVEVATTKQSLQATVLSLQGEIAEMKAIINNLEDEGRSKMATIEDLEAELRRSQESQRNADNNRVRLEAELDSLRSKVCTVSCVDSIPMGSFDKRGGEETTMKSPSPTVNCVLDQSSDGSNESSKNHILGSRHRETADTLVSSHPTRPEGIDSGLMALSQV